MSSHIVEGMGMRDAIVWSLSLPHLKLRRRKRKRREKMKRQGKGKMMMKAMERGL